MFLSIMDQMKWLCNQTLQRIIIEDFNGDNIDDIFHSKCLSSINNGKFKL